MSDDLKWGIVTDVGSPHGVRIVGDGVDTSCPMKVESATGISTNGKVLLARVGGSWVIVGVLVST